jgi:sugar lactone lactonase YvrE
MKRFLTLLAAILLGSRGVAGAQTLSTVPVGVTHVTENSASINGVRLQVEPDGSVWFLEATLDTIAVLRDGVITRWQLRPSDQLGANPVDFEVDGDIVWYIGSGQSQIPAGTCTFGKLDTTTGALTEWVVPGSLPAAFHRSDDGKSVWIAQSGSGLQDVDLDALTATSYRSPLTYAYSDMVVGPDGAFWLSDFGDNRIVRYVPGDSTETSWTFLNLANGRWNPSQIQFDQRGLLWIAQFTINQMQSFDPATSRLTSYGDIPEPVHFDIFDERLYVASNQSQSAVTAFDPGLAIPASSVTLTPDTLDVVASTLVAPVVVRNSTIVPTTFASPPVAATPAELAQTSPSPGILITQVPSTNNFGIDVSGGLVWLGTTGKLAMLNLQTVGGATDQSVPVATSLAGPADSKIAIQVTLSNLGTAPISGDALYLFSPGAFAPRVTFTLDPGETKWLPDMFGNVGSTTDIARGPVRIEVTTGNASDLLATVRSARTMGNGGTYGYSMLPENVSGSLGPGSSRTLFTGARDTQISVLGLYTLDETTGTLTLLAPDGTTRGTRPFALARNAAQEFNPASAAFGVAPEPGDIIRVDVSTGSLQAYVNVVDVGTFDVEPSSPVSAMTDAVIPNAGSAPGGRGNYVSDLYLSNPDASTEATVTLTFYPLDAAGAPLVETVVLPGGTSQAILDFLPTLFGVSSGQGALLVTSTAPVAAAARIALSGSSGDYGTFAAALAGTAGLPGGSSIAIGLPQTSTRRTNLLLYNRGAAGDITVTGFKADGSSAGSVSIPAGDHEAVRLNNVFTALGVSDQPAGRIQVAAPQGMKVYAWTAAVDSVTGDVDIAPLR